MDSKSSAILAAPRRYCTGGDIAEHYRPAPGAKLGAGNYGSVFKAVHVETGEEVAVKRVPKARCSESDVAAETSILGSLAPHPNIIGLRGLYESSDCFYIVMELARGGELYDRLVTQGKLAQPQARSVMRQLITAVNHLHLAGVVHGDLKPENVLIEEAASAPTGAVTIVTSAACAPAAAVCCRAAAGAGADAAASTLRVKLADFGSAFRVRSGPRRGAGSSYTAAYSPPEVVTGAAMAGPAADVWALGVVAYILLQGVHPFDPSGRASEAETLARVVGAEPEFSFGWEGIEPAARELVRAALSKDPAQRPTAAQMLSHPWMQAAVAPSA